MADLSKLRFNGTDYNVKDASAPLRKFTNYSKTGNLPITSDDTTQTAIGKLEKALDDKINTSAKGTSNGVAELDANGKVPSSQLPSYVDDVLEYSAKSSFPATGETGKIYVDTTTNKTYRWSGSAYVEISESLALGETSSTAYRGDRGKAAYDHSQITNGNPHGTTGANTNLTGYSKGSSKDAVAATDTVNAAIAKHENRINANQTNILYVLGKTGKNLVNPELFTEGGYISDTSGGAVIASQSSVYMDYLMISPNTEYFITSVGSSGAWGAWYDSNKNFISGINAYGTKTSPANAKYIRCTVSYNNTNPNYATTFMICTKADYDASPDYQPYRGLPNYDLTQLQAEDRAALVEQVDEGAKNIFDITTPDLLRDTVVTPLSNGGATLSCNNAAWTQYGKNIDVEVGKKYKVIVYIDSITGSIGTDLTVRINQGDLNIPIVPTNTGEYSIELDSKDVSLGIAIFINNSGTAKSLSINMRMMICTEADWKISQNFAPYALPNTDLTQLQAEDRAALAEEIDAGAKNKLDISGWYVSNARGITFTESGGVITASGNNDGTGTSTATLAILSGTQMQALKGCILSGSVSKTGYNIIIQRNASPWNTVVASVAGEPSAPIPDINYECNVLITIVSGTTQSAATQFYPMICTEADWKVSQKYAPYRKNLDQLEATKAPALVLGQGVSSGSLDDVTKPTFDLYLNTVSNLPTATSAYYVETSVWDSQSMIQRAYNASNAESYIRVKSINTWSAWKQITNT